MNVYSENLVVSSDYQNILAPGRQEKVTAKPAPSQPDTFWDYKTVNGKQLRMHVFLPDDYDQGSSFPIFAAFHGGSWAVGHPRQYFADCDYWRSRGMIAVSIEYRLKNRDKVQVPHECVKDAKSAIRYLRKNAEQLKMDPDRIIAPGGSAGGQLAAATAMINRRNTDDKHDDSSISCMPSALILHNPWFRCQKDFSPYNFVSEGLPPSIIFHGDKDPIPVEEMLALHQDLKKAGNDSEYYVGKNGNHGFCSFAGGKNPFFYWHLDLEDRFLVQQGILTGESKVNIPSELRKILGHTQVTT